MKLEDLKSIGFEEVGYWELHEGPRSRINFALNNMQNERTIYAFCVDGESKYVGICQEDHTSLKNRMKRYKYMAGSGTNKRIAELILKSLMEKQAIAIYALKPTEELKFHGIEIDLIKALEYPLISRLNNHSSWNRMASSRS